MKKVVKSTSRFKEKKLIFCLNNSLAHKDDLAKEKLRDLMYELLEDPPYLL